MKFAFQSLQTGETSLVVGTHSLISEKVEFSALRIAVVDEQHRFGVVQRGKFSSKVVASSVGCSNIVLHFLEKSDILSVNFFLQLQ